jgi:TM2 domain-containing membrane protein YozV
MDEKIIIQQRPTKSPAVAAILSVIFPGLGALYNGLIVKAIFYALFAIWLIVQLSAHAVEASAEVFMGLLLGGLWLFQIVDSVNNAKSINLAMAKQKANEAADVEVLPKVVPSGSIFWGIALIVLGGLLVLMNFDVIDIATLFSVILPVAVIIIGVKFVFDALARAKNGK